MVVRTPNKEKLPAKYIFTRKAGRSIIDRKPIFSPDGESIAIIVENLVRVYNIQTGECVRTLETNVATDELIAIQFPDDENYNLCGCSDTGYVITWTWEHGALLKETKLQIPEAMKILTFNLVDSNECFVTAREENSKNLHLGTYSVKNGSLLYEYSDLKITYFNILSVSLGWCNGDRYAAIINGTMVLYVQNLYKPHLKMQLKNHTNFRILAVDAHHKDNAIAITDTLGRVTIIKGNLYDYRSVAREILHWHFLPPMAVCFSLQGSYIISGGMEKVLVKWTLGDLAHKHNEKAFIPRLPGMVRFVTANSTHIAATLSNNSVVIANAQMHVTTTILECGGLSPMTRALSTPLVYHRRLSALLMPGRTGHLQLYSTTTDKVLYNIDITRMNSIPAERQNLFPRETEVTCAATSANGTWLVTSEYRYDKINYPEEKLKFWALQSNMTTRFKLNTCVNLSHGGCKVAALALNDKGEFCVSSGSDQKFRIWKRGVSQIGGKRIYWHCLTACYYSSGVASILSDQTFNKFKSGENLQSGDIENLPYMKWAGKKNDIVDKIFNIHKTDKVKDENDNLIGGVAISQDGSLIAAWFGVKLTLWDSHLCNLRTTLSHPALRPKGEHVRFGNNDAAHYLVCTTKSCVAVWSLLSLTIKWMVQIEATCLISDPFSNKMAMITRNNDVFVFTPHSSTPILVEKKILNPEDGIFKKCDFGSSSGDDVRLYMMRNNAEVYCLEPETSNDSHLEVISKRKLPTSKFSALIAEQQLYDVRSNSAADVFALNKDALGNNAIAQFMSGAPHMLPPISLLCPLFLHHISGYEEIEEENQEEENIMEVDPHSSDDESSEVKITSTQKPIQLWAPNYEDVKEKKLKKILKEPFLDVNITSSVFNI